MRKTFLVFLLAGILQQLCAQQGPPEPLHVHDTLVLKQVSIITDRIKHFEDASKLSISLEKSKPASLTLDESLNSSSLAFIKPYAPGGLSTLSIRGTGASHSTVMWNGLNLQSPMNGTIDLALIGTASASIKTFYGPVSTRYDNGALGATISIDDQIERVRQTTVNLAASLGSFGQQQQSLQVLYAAKNTSVKVNYLHCAAKNDYSYFEEPVKRLDKRSLQHAAYQEHVVNFSVHHSFPHSGTVMLAGAYTFADRQIPAVIGQANSQALQQDDQLRLVAKYHSMRKKKSYFLLSTGFLLDKLHYISSSDQINALYRSYSSISQADYNYAFNTKHSLQFTGAYTFVHAEAEAYGSKGKNQNRAAVVANYKYYFHQDRYLLSISAREELVQDKFSPFLASALFVGRLKKLLSFNLSAAKVYRYPTLNDLYWIPGGNPNLKPEKGGSLNGGLCLSTAESKYVHAEIKTQLFSTWMDNWIIWLPSGNYWSPRNVQKVWSRGLDVAAAAYINHGKFESGMDIAYELCYSTNLKTSSVNDASQGKQLIYEPLHKFNAGAYVGYAGLRFGYRMQFVGMRYTSSDNSSSLPAYTTGDATLSYDLKLKSFNANFYLQCKNCWNASYQVLAERPMPGRSLLFGINLTAHQYPKHD